MNFTVLKIVSVVSLMILCFVGGWYSNNRAPVVETKTEVVEKVVTKIVTEKVSQPDGTQKETTTTTKEENSKTQAKDPKPVPVITTTLPQYSIGLGWNPRHFGGDKYSPSSIDFGYRLLGNAWGVAGYDWSDKTITVGIRVDF